MMQIFRDGTLTIESLDGNKLYLVENDFKRIKRTLTLTYHVTG